ncbi:MAG: stage III sporulation protein AE [Firmicutes bacterium]|nr:stage III sporulation protein AE [Bacillota bacterium]MBO2520684.1 stage III sporulation protein AE [Bacillota bacterium]
MRSEGAVAVRLLGVTSALVWTWLLFAGTGAAAAPGPGLAETFSPESLIERQLEELSLDSVRQIVTGLDAEVKDHLPELDLRRIIFEGDGVDAGRLARALAGAFWREVRLNIALLGQLVLLGVLCALLRAAAQAGGGAEAADVALMLSLLVLLLLGLHAFRAAVQLASGTLKSMVSFMQAMLPPLATMLAAAGGVTSAAIFHPILYVTVTGIGTLVDAMLVPAVFACAALSVAGAVSQDFPVGRLEGLLRSAVMTALGLCFIAFFAVVQVRGALAPVADGFAFRTAKFLTGTFVPLVGGKIADAMDVIVGGSVLIKNALGAFGMTAVAVMTAFPLVKLFSIFAVFRVATALVEPVTDPRLVQAMAGLSNSLALLLAGLITAALMFFVAITVVVGVGNTAAVMR